MKQKYKEVTFIDGHSEIRPVQKRPETFVEGFSSCPSLSRGLSVDVLESVQGQNRTSRTTRINEKDTPFRGTEIITVAVTCFGAVGTTLAGFELWVQLAFYAFAFALVIGFDPMFLFSRVFAPQTRLLFAIMFILCSVSLIWDKHEMYIVTLIYTVVTILLYLSLNKEWLDNFNFEMSPAVQQILNNSPDSRAFESWNYYGKKDSITYARYQSNSTDEHIVNGLYRPFWLLGYNSAYKTVTAVVNRAERAEEQAEDFKEKYKTAEAERKKLELINVELEKMAEKATGRADGNKWRIETLEKALEDAQEQIKLLMQTNDELVLMMPEAETIEEAGTVVKEDKESRVIELLKAGTSVRKTAELTGLSKTKVGEIRVSLVVSGEIPEKIVPMSATA